MQTRILFFFMLATATNYHNDLNVNKCVCNPKGNKIALQQRKKIQFFPSHVSFFSLHSTTNPKVPEKSPYEWLMTSCSTIIMNETGAEKSVEYAKVNYNNRMRAGTLITFRILALHKG